MLVQWSYFTSLGIIFAAVIECTCAEMDENQEKSSASDSDDNVPLSRYKEPTGQYFPSEDEATESTKHDRATESTDNPGLAEPMESDFDDNVPLASLKTNHSVQVKRAVKSDESEFDDSDNDKDYFPSKSDIHTSDSDENLDSRKWIKTCRSSKEDSRPKAWQKKGKHIKRKYFKSKRQLFHSKRNEELVKKFKEAKSNVRTQRCSVARKKNSVPPGEQSSLGKVILKSRREQNLKNLIEKYHTQRLDNLLASNGLERVRVEADGDCFFSAVRNQLENDISVSELRSKLAEHLKEQKSHYIQFMSHDQDDRQAVYERDVACIEQMGEWKMCLADCLPLAVANTFQRKVKIFSSQISHPVTDIKPDLASNINDDNAINLAYVKIQGKEHYDSVKSKMRTSQVPQSPDKSTPSKQSSSNVSPGVTPHKDARFQSPKRTELKRKRKCTPEIWKRNVRKRNRDAGLEYTTQKGNVRKARIMSLQDYQRQRDFICQHVDSTKPKRTSGFKSVTYSYYLPVGATKVRVCRTVFTKTLDIGKKTIHVALAKKEHGMFVGGDKRGTFSSANKISDEKLDQIRKHIESFPRMESHYVRKETKREYLSHDLTIRKMWELYVQKCKEREQKPASEKKYREIFCTEYNLSFFTPKKDQCSTCASYEAKKAQGQLDEQTETLYVEHQKRKAESRAEKENDKERSKNDPKYYAATFDMQAVLTTPCSLVGELYYKRKLSCYNLSVYSLGDGQGTCYLWDETQAGRGACEIASCLLMHTRSVTSRGSQVQEITYFSDTCGGQNRNQFVAAAFLYLVNQSPSLKTINHKFFERGHSHMECDSIHSTIEAAKKRTTVYVPSMWHTVVSLARKRKPFVVVPVKYIDISDLKSFTKKYCPNMKFSTTGTRINWMKVKWIQVRHTHSKSIFLNETFDASKFAEVRIQSSTRSKGKSLDWPSTLSCLYNSKLCISEAKKKDLVSLCNTGVIPEEHHQYYMTLPSSKGLADKVPDLGSDTDSE